MPPNAQATTIQTSQKTPTSSRSLQRNPSLWKSNGFGFFVFTEPSLWTARKNKSFDHCGSHSLYCHEQFCWVQVSHLSHLTLYTRLDLLFQWKWRKQQQQQHNHLCALMLQAQLHFGAVCDFVKPKVKLRLISLFFCHASGEDEANKQGEADRKATTKVCLRCTNAWKERKVPIISLFNWLAALVAPLPTVVLLLYLVFTFLSLKKLSATVLRFDYQRRFSVWIEPPGH